MTTAAALAIATRVWAGEAIGLLALGIFVVFAAWIVLQRLRGGPPASPEPGPEEDRRG